MKIPYFREHTCRKMESESLKKFLIPDVSLGLEFTVAFQRFLALMTYLVTNYYIFWIRFEAIKSATIFRLIFYTPMLSS